MANVLLAILLVFLVLTLVGALLLQWLWNWTMPQQFGLKPLNFGPALRLLLIGWLLTGAACQINGRTQAVQRSWHGGQLPGAR